jgi:hypothetical protein
MGQERLAVGEQKHQRTRRRQASDSCRPSLPTINRICDFGETCCIRATTVRAFSLRDRVAFAQSGVIAPTELSRLRRRHRAEIWRRSRSRNALRRSRQLILPRPPAQIYRNNTSSLGFFYGCSPCRLQMLVAASRSKRRHVLSGVIPSTYRRQVHVHGTTVRQLVQLPRRTYLRPLLSPREQPLRFPLPVKPPILRHSREISILCSAKVTQHHARAGALLPPGKAVCRWANHRRTGPQQLPVGWSAEPAHAAS